MKTRTYQFLLVVLAVTAGCRCEAIFAQDLPVSFNRDIRPILSDKCFQCHGPDEHAREAGLRLDVREQALDLVEPGDPDESELIYRVHADDPDERMPPPEINKPLSERELQLLKRWVEEGANWSEFWAYVEPVKFDVPDSKFFNKSANWIDRMVSSRLETLDLQLSGKADKVTLIRRVYFDLIGLPPTPEQVQEFVEDGSADAFEKVVDSLLASPHFGERMAVYWLDLVRYADTVGYHGDQDHNISPYRDWVIDAFNKNMPFDQFTREQLAGDLLPKPTISQKVASGYNRLLQTTHEGGLQPKEYSAIYAADRVRNVSVVWMGATVGCAQCHDHKYDPYTSTDFYSLAAFFADIDDESHFKTGTNSLPTKRPPEILLISEQDRARLDEFQAQIKTLEQQVAETKQELAAQKKAAQQKQESKSTDGADDSCNPNPDDVKQVTEQLESLQKELNAVKSAAANTERRGRWSMVTQALEQPRTIRVLPRGNWLDESGPIVEPAIPKFLGSIKTAGPRATRLDLANWLTDANQASGKLTARVMANRIWYLLMGVGISKSLDDFGGQGEAPAFPELLDNLAIEFVETQWDLKSLIRQIVTSQTYQQTSMTSESLQQTDPYNQLFARQSRFRLPAEMVRDNALAISGLLVNDQIGGRSVKPYQPAGYYQHLNFPVRKYVADADRNQWRRGVYVHWQRQFLHPTLKALDAPSREECTAQRARSNTPSAALALLNDPCFVEAARVFAEQVIRETPAADSVGDNPSDLFVTRLERMFERALSRKPDPAEQALLQQVFAGNYREFSAAPASAASLIAVGIAPVADDLDAIELAAWTMVARAILNTNESMTRN